MIIWCQTLMPFLEFKLVVPSRGWSSQQLLVAMTLERKLLSVPIVSKDFCYTECPMI